jgi:hypothetical protein
VSPASLKATEMPLPGREGQQRHAGQILALT